MADPKHLDIAALVERLDFIACHTGTSHAKQALLDAAAALRTLTRPVEDEEVGPLLTRAKIELAWDDPAVRGAVRIPGKPTPNERPFPKWLATKMCDALARLAREKASAEQERDEAREIASGLVFTTREQALANERATRAEQEAARLRAVVEDARANVTELLNGGLRFTGAAIDSLRARGLVERLERALDAAAGTPE
jgi:hypothetical protein